MVGKAGPRRDDNAQVGVFNTKDTKQSTKLGTRQVVSIGGIGTYAMRTSVYGTEGCWFESSAARWDLTLTAT